MRGGSTQLKRFHIVFFCRTIDQKNFTYQLFHESKKQNHWLQNLSRTTIGCLKNTRIMNTINCGGTIFEEGTDGKKKEDEDEKLMKKNKEKPPNILVYSKEQDDIFKLINSIQSVLPENSYLVYPLTNQQIVQRLWMENATLLIVSGSLNSDFCEIFLEYFSKGGKILLLNSKNFAMFRKIADCSENNVSELCEIKILLKKSSNGKAVFIQLENNSSIDKFLTCSIENLLNFRMRKEKQNNIYEKGYLLGDFNTKIEILRKLKTTFDAPIKANKLTMQFINLDIDKVQKPSKEFFPIMFEGCPKDFSPENYFSNLKTESIGRLLIYAPVITSSMHVINGLELKHGIAVVSRRQTNGIGRHFNQWLSPDGCAMFSLQLHIEIDSVLGKRISLLQHIIATAIVKSVLSIEDYSNLKIGIKWPNDIYANDKLKIGGIIVNTILQDQIVVCNIGCGFNLNNSLPTLCINDMIRENNLIYQKNAPILSLEKHLSKCFNEIENLIKCVQNNDLNYFLDLYYKFWLHKSQSIKIKDKLNSEKAAEIIGIDDYGYLIVKLEDGSIETVHPDGNSFDMLRGLIIPKQ